MLYYAGTQVEPVTADTEVPCEIIYIHTCSTPQCNPVKSAGYYHDDHNKDQDYSPTNLFSAEVMEEEKDKKKKGPTAAEVSCVVGTLIHVTQKCLTCSFARLWRSRQPYI